MPFNPGGVFSLVASYFAQAGATIRTEQHNPPLEDISASLSLVLIRDGRAPMTGALNMNGFAINNIAAGTSPGSVATLAQAMPIGAVIDFAGASAPAGWALCYGQAVSRTTYAALFSALGTSYGVGDGSTTFNLPDCRGRVAAGRDNMGGAAAYRLTSDSGVSGTILSAVGGSETHTLTAEQLPSISPTFTGIADTVTVTTVRSNLVFGTVAVAQEGGGGTIGCILSSTRENNSASSTGSFTPSGTISPIGAGGAHNNVQPTIILNKIIRVSYDG